MTKRIFLVLALIFGLAFASLAVVSPADAGYGKSSWGEAAVECGAWPHNNYKFTCGGWVDDIKTDGYCVYMYGRKIGGSWQQMARSCGASKSWSKVYAEGETPYYYHVITRGPWNSNSLEKWIYEFPVIY